MTETQDRSGQAPRAADSNSHDVPTVPDPARLLDSALAYAGRGWPVFPCRAGGKAPLTRQGFKDATTDPDQIRAWWRRWPRANVAIATGTLNGAASIDVVDVDVRPSGSGWAALNRLQRARLLVGAFARVATPSGGLHLYFPGTDQRGGPVKGQHLDLKSSGGYVVAPPSVVGGAAYELLEASANVAGGRADFDAIRRLLDPPPACVRRA
ncbi:bifunctional DNA primase/polymerase, partial [Spirillospora sp. NPDC049652]